MSFWSGLGNILTGGISGLFTKGSSGDSASAFFNDPLGYGSKARSEQLQRDAFNFQKESWNKEFQLQQNQFEYQKWFDQNNVTLQAKQNAELGINPMVANGAGTSSVSASGSPSGVQMPGQSGVSDVVGTILNQLGQNHRADVSAGLEQQQIDNEKAYRDEVLDILRTRADNESDRTGAYTEETKVRIEQMLNDLEKQYEGDYGSKSSPQKRLIGEIRHALSGAVSSANDYAETKKPVPKYKPGRKEGSYDVSAVVASDGYKKAAKAAADKGRYLSPHDYINGKR